MGKISHSSIQRTQIVTLHREGYSEHEISVQTDCRKIELHNTIAKYQADDLF